MKAQLSLELLIYLALAGLAALFTLKTAAPLQEKMFYMIDSYKDSLFMQRINHMILAKEEVLQNIYIPKGMCNFTEINNTLTSKYGSFPIVSLINITKDAFCPDSTYASISFLINASTLKRVQT